MGFLGSKPQSPPEKDPELERQQREAEKRAREEREAEERRKTEEQAATARGLRGQRAFISGEGFTGFGKFLTPKS